MVRPMNASRFANPLASRPLPKWFDDAKLGIFVHWGIHTVPGWAPLERYAESHESEHYQNYMALPNSVTARYHEDHYSDLAFDAFADQFRDHVEHWDPELWADLFQRAGARCVVLTTVRG
jgi:alpha-L-fucosidase